MNHLDELLKKYINNSCTDDELKILLQSFRESENENALKKLINENLNGTKTEDEEDPALDAKVYRIFDKLRTQIEQETAAPVVRRSYRMWYGIAAAVLLLLASSIYFFPQAPADSEIAKGENTASAIGAKRSIDPLEIKPGGKKAILTLANGKNIVLNNIANGMLSNQGGIQINKTDEGELVYHAEKQAKLTAPQFNKISIPKGGQYQLTLPDGTKVWINSDSELKFPTHFVGKERRVELIGEAYFEVEKNKQMPFKVISGNQVVEVLGTHFNVNSYKDEQKITTTLLEGSVKVYHSDTKKSLLLHPGEQSVVTEDITVSPASVEEAVAWKEGLLAFKDADIKHIMNQLARWYDVEVFYKGDIPTRLFTGKIPIQANLSEMLKVLEKSKIHFKTEGRTITVIP